MLFLRLPRKTRRDTILLPFSWITEALQQQIMEAGWYSSFSYNVPFLKNVKGALFSFASSFLFFPCSISFLSFLLVLFFLFSFFILFCFFSSSLFFFSFLLSFLFLTLFLPPYNLLYNLLIISTLFFLPPYSLLITSFLFKMLRERFFLMLLLFLLFLVSSLFFPLFLFHPFSSLFFIFSSLFFVSFLLSILFLTLYFLPPYNIAASLPRRVILSSSDIKCALIPYNAAANPFLGQLL